MAEALISGFRQVEVLARRPGAVEVAVLASALEGDSWDAELRVYRCAEAPGAAIHATGLGHTAHALAWTTSGNHVVVGNDAGELAVFSVPQRLKVGQEMVPAGALTLHDDAIAALAALPNAPVCMASGSWDGSIAITTIGAVAATAAASAAAAPSSSSSSGGGKGAASSAAPPVVAHQWRAHAGQVLALAARGALESSDAPSTTSAASTAALAGPLLASAGSDDAICLWATGGLPAEAPALLLRIPLAARATALAWLQQQQHGGVEGGSGLGSAGSPFLLVGLQDGTACCYVVHPGTGEALAAPVPTGAHGASGSFASAIKLWVPPHVVLHHHAANGMGAPVTSICSAPAPTAGEWVVATGGEDCAVRTTRVMPVAAAASPVPALTVVAAVAAASASASGGSADATAAAPPAARVGDYVTSVCAVPTAPAAPAATAAVVAAGGSAATPTAAPANLLWFGCMDGKVRAAGL